MRKVTSWLLSTPEWLMRWCADALMHWYVGGYDIDDRLHNMQFQFRFSLTRFSVAVLGSQRCAQTRTKWCLQTAPRKTQCAFLTELNLKTQNLLIRYVFPIKSALSQNLSMLLQPFNFAVMSVIAFWNNEQMVSENFEPTTAQQS